jgi:Ca2+-binding RTX toxin-like protein
MIMPLFFSGNPLNGGAGNDFLLDYDGNAAAGAQNGGDGNDVILGDFGFFNTQFAGSSYNSTATALNVDASGVWYTDNRAYIATGSTPHTSIYIEGRAGEQRYISFIATAGATISLDIDFAGNIGTGWDSTLTLLDSGGTQLAFNDDSALDGGSFSGLDSKLTFTATYSGTYYVRVGTFGGNFVGGETGILNISVSGHVASGNPFIGADTIDGGNGNDVLYGGSGTGNTINGGLGDDRIISNGFDNVNAGDGNDTVFAGNGSSAETLDGGLGTDLLDTTTWNSTYDINLATGVTNFGENFTNFENIITGNGNTTILGTTGNNIITTGSGNDTVTGNGGTDTVVTGLGNDIIFSGGDGVYNAGDGDDTVFAGLTSISETLDGGNGIDTLNTTSFGSDYVVNLTTGLTNFSIESFSNFENLTSGAGNDTLTGTSGANIINGGAGNDTIDGVGGADTIHGDAGDDILTSSGSNNFIFGDDGNDTVFAGLGTPETLDGGNGIDTLNTTSFGSNYTVNLASGTTNFSGESFTNFENLVSGAGNDTLVGTPGNNVIDGGGGTDYLIGFAGDDTLIGGGVAAVGQGNTLQGGLGNDTYVVSVREDSTLEFAEEGYDTVRTTFNIFALQNNVERLIYTDAANHGAGVGNALDNELVGNVGADDLFGREGNDTILGGTGAANTLFGQAGNDTYISQAVGDSIIEFVGEGIDTVNAYTSSFALRLSVENLVNAGGTNNFVGVGSSEDNQITGGTLVDFLNGLAGNDIITGGSGNDELQGGAGADQFRYFGGETGLDRILDFTSGQDKIALFGSGFTHTAVIDFIQTGAPAPTSTNSTFLHDVNSGIVSYDADGTGAGAAVQLAQLNPGLTLAAGDFIFF